MSIPPVITSYSSANAARAIADVRPVGNAASSGTFDGESEDDARVGQRRVTDRRAPYLSQNSTGNAPLWYGPRLRPVFVAQVLGQILMHDRGAQPSTASYRSPAQVMSGRLLSRDI